MTRDMRACLLSVVVALASSCVRGPPPPALNGAQGAGTRRVGEALDFTLKRYPSQVPFTLSSDRGSVVLLDVWASWCEPCEDAFPVYGDLLTQYGPRGLKVYGINIDADARQIAPFLERTKSQLPILLDPDAVIAESTLQVSMMPTTFILDRKGVVRHVHEGFAEESLGKYVSEIEALLGEGT